MILTVPVTSEGRVDPRFGKATTMVVADVTDGQITDWQTHEVGWDVLHDQGEHGTHHARIVRFLKEHQVDRVVYAHMGPPMLNTIGKMGLELVQVEPKDAREAVTEAATAQPARS